jgi:hypothetical protein
MFIRSSLCVRQCGARLVRSRSLSGGARAGGAAAARKIFTVGRVAGAGAGSAVLLTASLTTACDAAAKFIETASGLQYVNTVVGKGPVATKGSRAAM